LIIYMNNILEDILEEVLKAASNQGQQEQAKVCGASGAAASQASPLTAFFKIIEPNLSDLESTLAQKLGCNKDVMRDNIMDGVSCIAKTAGGGAPVKADVALVGESYNVYIDLPGVNKSDIDISISSDKSLVVSVVRKPHTEVATYVQREIKVGKLERVVTVPKNADINTIKATYENGVLVIKMNKIDVNTRTFRKIAVL
jgi:HSP20 family molecular chaperone IbpA